MPQENIDVLRGAYEAFNRGDLDAVLQICDPEVECRLPEGGLNAGTLRGHEALRRFMASYTEAFEHFRGEPEEFFEDDGRVLVLLRMFGRGRGSGLEIDVRPAHLWTMRGGKAVRFEPFTEEGRPAAREAFGLSP